MKGIYIVGGYPSRKEFRDRAALIHSAGFDFIEVGIPFNDPVADGPVITETVGRVLESGITTENILEDIISISHIPIKKYIMTYANIPYAYGYEKFTKKMEHCITGMIIADLPNRMASRLTGMHDTIPLVPFATLETRESDMDCIRDSNSDFVYFVGLRGTTGSRADLTSTEITEKITRVREKTGKKTVVGFGIKSRQDAITALEIADGYVIGTEAVRRQNDREEFRKFLADIVNIYN